MKVITPNIFSLNPADWNEVTGSVDLIICEMGDPVRFLGRGFDFEPYLGSAITGAAKLPEC
jgi:hypothetical protein